MTANETSMRHHDAPIGRRDLRSSETQSTQFQPDSRKLVIFPASAACAPRVFRLNTLLHLATMRGLKGGTAERIA